ncbi:MAG: B12-binding domain-containing radical SAM protein, partial [Candidatus Poribacteria bacterium]|nr:B12-binding domain-containing radical SAM protein [Candidatus Poribacteria bacterium]
MFPKNYELKVVDMNVNPLSDADLEWADAVFTSTMIVQKDSFYEVVRRCNAAHVPIVAGGPHPTSYYDNIREEVDGTVDHFLFGEVEDFFEDFLTDFESGAAKEVYRETKKPDVTKTPPPRYDLIDLKAYGSMALQFSRGCPFDCEFCDITKLFGRIPRTKTNEQMLTEFEMLYRLGWNGSLFVVDDNFIGNKRDAMRLLPEVAKWQEQRQFPFSLYTEASVNLVEIPDMLAAMSDAGFNMVFLGIESPNDEALEKTVKKQNTSKEDNAESYLLQAIRKIQECGMEVTGGFIIGLDGDTEFDSHIRFIQEAGIPMAMAGLLTALKGTNLYHRLEKEGRLLKESTGNNTDVMLNFQPELPREHLIQEYRRVVSTLYDPTLSNYFERCLTMLKHLKPTDHTVRKIRKTELIAVVKSIRRQLFSRQGRAYARFLANVLRHHFRLFPEAVRLAIMGYHFEKITRQTVAVDDFKQYLEVEFNNFKETVGQLIQSQSDQIGEVSLHVRELLARARVAYEDIHKDFRYSVQDKLDAFQTSVFKEYLKAELEALKTMISRFAKVQSHRVGEIKGYVQKLWERVHAQYEHLHTDLRHNVNDSLETFRDAVKSNLSHVTIPQMEGTN